MSDVAESRPPGDPDAVRGEIAAILAEGDASRALAMTQAALERWPLHYGLRMLQAESLHRSGRTADAIDAYLAFGREAKNGFWPLLRAVLHLREIGEIDRARRIFAEEIWPAEGPDDAKLRGLARLVTAADEGNAAAAFLSVLAAAKPPAPAAEALARLAALRARQGREAEAQEALTAARERGALPLRARAVEADLLLADGRMEELLPLAEALVAEEPDKVEHARRLVAVLFALNRKQQALVALATALRRWPGDWILLGRLNAIALPNDVLARSVTAIIAAAPPLKQPEISRFQIATALLTLGRSEEAIGLLESIAETGPTGVMAVPLREALGVMSPADWRARSQLKDDRAAAVQVVRAPGAHSALMMFGSPTGGHSHLPFGHFDALISDLPVHRIYLRDTRGRGFLQGMAEFGDGDESTVTGLRGILAELGGPRLVAMGSSVAGHAAARFGAALGAHAVALLASPTTFEGAPSGAERASPYNRLNLARRLAHNVLGDPSEADLLPVLSAAGVTRFFYYYGAGTERGERNAERLRDIAAVTLRPIQNTDHAGLPLRILARPDWPRLLHEDLGLPAVG